MAMRSRILLAGTSLVLAHIVSPPVKAEEPTANPFKGVWRVELSEAILPDGEVARAREVHESIVIFTDGYYTMNMAGGEEPSPHPATPLRPTDEEKLARFNTLLINGGPYDFDSENLYIHPTFALIPDYVGGEGTFRYSRQGDQLILEWTEILSATGHPDPITAQGVSFRYTLSPMNR